MMRMMVNMFTVLNFGFAPETSADGEWMVANSHDPVRSLLGLFNW